MTRVIDLMLLGMQGKDEEKKLPKSYLRDSIKYMFILMTNDRKFGSFQIHVVAL